MNGYNRRTGTAFGRDMCGFLWYSLSARGFVHVCLSGISWVRPPNVVQWTYFKLDISKFVSRWIVARTSQRKINLSLRKCGQGHVTHFFKLRTHLTGRLRSFDVTPTSRACVIICVAHSTVCTICSDYVTQKSIVIGRCPPRTAKSPFVVFVANSTTRTCRGLVANFPETSRKQVADFCLGEVSGKFV